MPTDHIFSTEQLIVSHGHFVKEIPNFSVYAGEIVHLKGPNGSGKTTFVKTLMEELPPHSGIITKEISKKSMTFIRQNLKHEISLPITIREWLNVFDAETIGTTFFSQEMMDRRFTDLSGGEKQKLSIISRLSKDTHLLILDEPFNHVDINSQQELLLFLKSLIHQSMVKAIVFIGHHNFKDFKVVEL